MPLQAVSVLTRKGEEGKRGEKAAWTHFKAIEEALYI
jgi:hypothetical protein